MINTLPEKVTKHIKSISKLYRLTATTVGDGARYTWCLLPYLMYAQGASRAGFLKNEILKCALDDFAAEIAKFIEYLLCRRFRVCVCSGKGLGRRRHFNFAPQRMRKRVRGWYAVDGSAKRAAIGGKFNVQRCCIVALAAALIVL